MDPKAWTQKLCFTRKSNPIGSFWMHIHASIAPYLEKSLYDSSFQLLNKREFFEKYSCMYSYYREILFVTRRYLGVSQRNPCIRQEFLCHNSTIVLQIQDNGAVDTGNSREFSLMKREILLHMEKKFSFVTHIKEEFLDSHLWIHPKKEIFVSLKKNIEEFLFKQRRFSLYKKGFLLIFLFKKEDFSKNSEQGK